MTDQVIITKEGVVVQRVDAATTVVTGVLGPSGVTAITAANDVDSTSLTEGSLLVYKTSTNRWTATVNLLDQTIDGGTY